MVFLSNISQQTKLVAVFFLIVIVHVVFKVFYLDYSCFWYDETFAVFNSQQDWGHIKHISEWDLPPPLYYYFLYIWRNLFGISEFAIRFSSVLFSSLAACMLYLISVKYFNKTTALIALVIYTASNEMYFYAHEARCYALLFFLILFSTYHFFRLNNKKSHTSIICLGIANFFIVYGHYVAGIILFFQVLLVLVFYNKDLFKRVAYAYAITLALIIWRFTKKMLILIFNHEQSYHATKPSFTDMQNAIFDFFNGKEYLLFYLGIMILAFCILFFKDFKINFITPEIKGTYLFCCSFGIIIICCILGLLTPVWFKRYAVFSIPFTCILIGALIGKLSNVKLKYGLTALVTLVTLSSFTKIDFHTDKKMNYRDAMQVIKKEKAPSTIIIAETRDMGALFAYYYDRNIFTDYKNLEADLNRNNIYLISGVNDLKKIDLNKYKKVILTQTFVQAGKENDKLLEFITSKYTKQNQIKDYEGINLYLFQGK